MPESSWSSVRALCSSFCNATASVTRLCPSRCLPECPATCQKLFIPSADVAAYSAQNGKGNYNLDPFFIATVACLAVGLLVACIYAIYLKYYSVRVRPRQRPRREVQIFTQVHGESGSLGLHASVICAIEVQTYVKADDPFREMDCAVCLNEFQDGDVLRILPKCSHVFHMPCVDVWLGSNISCPMCRACIVSHIAVAPAPEDHDSPV